jgi:integrase
MLALKPDDYQPKERQIVIRKAKGDEPRTIPVSDFWIQAVDAYLRARPKVDSDRLFISEFGGPLDPGQVRKAFRSYQEFAGIGGFTLHGLRHYALTQLAKTDL